jgi:glycolate oxidase iron-sulfur subunit
MSARGRIELVTRFLSDEIDPSDILDDCIFTCLLCGCCDNSCPRGISVTRAVYEARRKLALKWKKHRFYRAAIKYAFSNPVLAYRALQFLEQAGLLLALGKIKPFRTMRELKLKIPEDRLRKDISVFRVPEPRGRVALFVGCTVDFLYPSMGASFIQALNAMDFEVVLPKGEVCCGAPLLSMGLREEAAYLARKNLNTFKQLKVDAVISLCPTCTHFIRDVYQDLIGEGIMNAEDISKFICDSSLIKTMKPALKKSGKVIYHDPCHTVNYLGAVEEPRRILRALGVDFEEPAERGCCGLGGVVRLLHDNVSSAICEKRVAAFEGADMIVTSCPNCVLQLSGMIKDRPVKHIIEIIAAGMRKDRN